MWMSEAPMPVWMRGRRALASALPQASISTATARDKRADSGAFDFPRDQLHGLEIFGRRAGIAGFDDVHVQQRQLSRDGEFFPAAQPRAGRLFAVTQGGIEYGYFF